MRPLALRGQRIGLLGGSFDPPHAAHRQISITALRRLGLDAVWWLVTPGNPLKDTGALPPIAERLELCRQMARSPRIRPTDIETQLGTRYTVDTLAALRRRYPGVHFVWLMGADNLAGFHRWRGWRRISRQMPIAVVDRPGYTLAATASRAARALQAARLPENEAPDLAGRAPPAWVFLHGPRSALSSTAIRAARAAAIH